MASAWSSVVSPVLGAVTRRHQLGDLVFYLGQMLGARRDALAGGVADQSLEVFKLARRGAPSNAVGDLGNALHACGNAAGRLGKRHAGPRQPAAE